MRVSVLGGDGSPASGLDVALTAGRSTTKLPACAAGCYQAEVATSTLAGRVTVSLGASRYGFALPAPLRLPDGAATVARAGVVWRGLKTLVWHERLAASPTEALNTVYKAVAPDQLALHDLEPVVGDHHRAPALGPADSDCAVDTLDPEPAGAPAASRSGPGSSDARVIGSGVVGGRPVWEITFFDPADAGLVRREDRQAERPHAAARHDRRRALHAPRVRAVQRPVPASSAGCVG